MDLAVMHEKRRGHAFHRATIGGSNNRVHLGDHITGTLDGPRQSAVDRARDALFLTEPQDDRAGLLVAKAGIVDGTCEWILKHEKFLRWSTLANDDESALPGLWVSGGPGKGKTMLAIYVSQILERDYAGLADRTLLYYFCAHNDDKRNTPVTILRSWTRQLLHDEPDLVHHVLPDSQGPAAQAHTLTNLDTLWRIFATLVAKSSKEAVFCVLDGLDECDTQLDHFLSQVQAYFRDDIPRGSGKLRLIVFSRDTQTCSLGKQNGFDRISLDSDADQHVQNAIRLFIQSRVVPVASDNGGGTEGLTAALSPFVRHPTEQTFIWIGYVANELQGCRSQADIEQVLEGVPRELDAIYERMVEHVYQADQERCRRPNTDPEKVTGATKKMLQWVALARRPLTLMEAAVILDMKKADNDSHTKERVRGQIRQYGHLLQVNDDKVQLLHKSAGDYLTRGAPFVQGHLEQYRVRTQAAHKAIATSCLELLQLGLTRNPFLGIEEAGASSILNSVPLLNYAILYWPEHIRQAEVAADTASISAGSLLNSPVIREAKLRSRWWKCYWDITPNDRYVPTSFSLLHLAAYFGLQELAAHELNTRNPVYWFLRPIDRRDSHGRTPLSWAAERGHLKIVQLLIDKNADMEICEVGGGRALNRSFLSGCPDVTELLIYSGAEIDYLFEMPFPDARTGEQWRALNSPSEHLLRRLGENSFGAMLLRNMRHVSPRADLLTFFWFLGLLPTSMLLGAAAVDALYSVTRGFAVFCLAIVWATLLTAVVDYLRGGAMYAVMAWADGELFTPLLWSMYTCSSEITGLILMHMEQPDFHLGRGRSLLSQAAQSGNLRLVSQILDRGVPVDKPESSYILQRLRGSLVKRVLERCWDGLEYPTDSLHRRSIRAEERRRTALEDAFATPSGNGCTALARAAQGPLESVVEMMDLLIKRGANPNATDVWGQTPLFYVAYEGVEDAACLLLSQGNVDVNVLSDLQETPLSIAVRCGHLEFVKFLVSHGADVTHNTWTITQALCVAAAHGNLGLVQYLVEKGVPINTPDKYENTPLFSAVRVGSLEIVAFLLQNGAAVDIKFRHGFSPIMLAALDGNEECVDLLLTHQAPPASTTLLGLFFACASVLLLRWRTVRLLLRRKPRLPKPS